jgi:HK97 family phage major capsid protein
MRLEFLKNKRSRLKAKLDKLVERANASEDAKEVRDLTEEVEEVKEEIKEVDEEISAIESEGNDDEERSKLVNADISKAAVASFKLEDEKRSGNLLESVEYRTAFMHHIQKGEPLPVEMREAISTGDTGAAIPITVMNEVINTVRKRYGNLYSKVRKMSVPGGVEIPIGSLEASFKWINESTVSPRQRVGKLGKISFGYHTAEIRIAQTFLSSILTLSAFEAELTRLIAIAYVKAMDTGIVNGSGDGSMTGILNDPRVTNYVVMSASDMSDWTKWRKNFFAQLPLGYRAGEFIFASSTVDAYLETMADSNNNPIFRQATGLEVNDGDVQNPNGRFFGREVALVEPDILPDFDSASKNDVIGIFWQPDEYAINENWGFTMRRYFDEETNEWVDKALTVVDGKVLNPTGFYLIKKG